MNVRCKKCGHQFSIEDIDAVWVEEGTYSEKLTVCPECGCIFAIEYIEDKNLYVNEDRRYYQYNKKGDK